MALQNVVRSVSRAVGGPVALAALAALLVAYFVWNRKECMSDEKKKERRKKHHFRALKKKYCGSRPSSGCGGPNDAVWKCRKTDGGDKKYEWKCVSKDEYCRRKGDKWYWDGVACVSWDDVEPLIGG